MATNFPNSIQTFPTMLNMTASDADIVTRYQEALFDTSVAVQKYYATKFSNGYIVSDTQPAGQETGDYWFKLGKELA